MECESGTAVYSECAGGTDADMGQEQENPRVSDPELEHLKQVAMWILKLKEKRRLTQVLIVFCIHIGTFCTH